jgi:double-strand break repair protein MRE11
MLMDIDAVGSDFEEPVSDEPPPKKKTATRSAPNKKAPAQKAPAKSRGKKAVVVRQLTPFVWDINSLLFLAE